jgi:hypothetical protein
MPYLSVTSKVEQLSEVLSELLALAADFARDEAKLSAALTKHELLCTAMCCIVKTSARQKIAGILGNGVAAHFSASLIFFAKCPFV